MMTTINCLVMIDCLMIQMYGDQLFLLLHYLNITFQADPDYEINPEIAIDTDPEQDNEEEDNLEE